MIPTNAPVKKARYKQRTIFGNPNTSPKRKANLTSPKPMPLPLVASKSKRKSKKGTTAEGK